MLIQNSILKLLNYLHRQLSMEKSYLENSYEQEGKAKDRMSMQVAYYIEIYCNIISIGSERQINIHLISHRLKSSNGG